MSFQLDPTDKSKAESHQFNRCVARSSGVDGKLISTLPVSQLQQLQLLLLLFIYIYSSYRTFFPCVTNSCPNNLTRKNGMGVGAVSHNELRCGVEPSGVSGVVADESYGGTVPHTSTGLF